MARTVPPGKRSRSVPSGSIPSKRPAIRSAADRWTVSSVPMACACASHALAKLGGSLLRHRVSTRAIDAARSGAKACGVVRPPRCPEQRSGMSGAEARFTPTPMTTRRPCRSSRMPASFAPSRSRSFGHLRSNGSPGTAVATASMSASPAASDSDCGGGSLLASSTSVLPKKLPSRVSHSRPWRPLPAVCSSATSQSPSTAERSARRSAFVEPVRSTIWILFRTATLRRVR